MNLLLLEDEPHDADLIKKTLHRSGFDFCIDLAADKDEFLQALNNCNYDIILSDNSLPQFNAVSALKLLKEKGIVIPFILVTGTTTDEFAVEIMKEGACDYVLKDRLNRLPSAIIRAIKNNKIEIEGKKNVTAIIKSEALMKDAERLANFGSWEVDRISNSYYWSDHYYRILDYEIGEVPPSADSFFNRVHPQDLSYVKQSLEIALNNFENHFFECRIVYRNGAIKHMHNKLQIIRDADNNTIRITGFAMDITETRQAEAQLKNTELSYKRVVDNIIDGLVIDDINGKVVYANEQFLKIFGFIKDDLQNLNIEDYVAPEYKTLLRDQHTRRIAGERVPNIFEFLGKRKDGEKRWIEVSVSKVYENGNISGTQSAIRDITKAKIAEELRQQSEANLRAIFDNTDIGYILLNTQYKIVSFNLFVTKFAAELLDRKLVEGKYITNYFKGDTLTLIKDAIDRVMNGNTIQHEIEICTAEGLIKWFTFSYNAILNNDNKIIGVLMSMNDITNRKVLELQGQKIKDDLIRRNNDLEQFAYIISHNLRSPVATIIGLTNILIEDGLDTDDADRIVTDLQDTTQKLDNIIRDLNKILSVNKDISENKEIINFQELTVSIKELLKNNFADVKFSIITDFDGASEIYALKSYIHSVFMNLISNSIKYKKASVEPIIDIKSQIEGNNIIIVFKDNGVGIDMQRYGKKIFGMYNRFHNHVEGKGMGLFMVKTQIELLGGNISLKSAINEGTEFRIEIPNFG